MKKLLITATLFAGLLLAAPAPAQILDAPHNASAGMTCTDCHVDPYSLVYTDDLCLSCHNNSTGGGFSLRSAPRVRTHSSGNTSVKYGDWSIRCLDCHSKHGREQRATYQSLIFLVSGTITSITDNGDGTTTFGYANVTESSSMPGWSDYTKWGAKSWGNFFNGNERGLILYPNKTTYKDQSAISFEVAYATATTIVTKGSISAAFPRVIANGGIAVGNPFGLAYGQFANSSLEIAPSVFRNSGFLENSGMYSFAFSTAVPPSTVDPLPDGVCQACHTQTVHWRNDGTLADHYNAQNCTSCHKHEEGFKVSCDGCHPAPPSTGAHVVHFDAGFAEYGTTAVQSTATVYGFNCGTCHSGTHLSSTVNPRSVDISFAGLAVQDGASGAAYSAGTTLVDDPGTGYTFNYSDGSCSSVYCHGNYPGSGRNATLSFNSGSAACGSCHNASNTAPPASGSHVKHASSAQYNMSCTLCHAGEVSGAGPASYAVADKRTHVSGAVDWAFNTGDTRVSVASRYSVTSGTAMPSNGLTPRPYGTCSTTYCHSDGTSVVTLNLGAAASPVWGSGPAACSSCHGAPPSYPSGSPKANSHAAHASNGCNACHVNTTADGVSITSFVTHANKAYDVNPNLASGVTFTYAFAATGGSCSNISCHGNGSGTWGATLTCSNCHLGTTDVDDFAGSFANNGVTSKIQSAGQWDATGHGRPAASGAYASGNAAANFTGVNACQYCHDNTIAHNTSANPFRLRNVNDATWGLNGVCQNCHADMSTGVVVDSALRNGAKKVGSVHYGIKHSTNANGGRTCWDCHDAHGDGNVFMIQGAVARTSDAATGAPLSTATTSFVAFGTGTDYAKSSAPFDGICNACHAATAHYTTTSGDGHNADARCTSCHTHTGDTAMNGFRAVCDACHGIPPVDNTTLAGRVFPSSTGSTVPGAHATHVTNLQIACDSCHANSVGTGLLHNNGDLTVSMGFSLFGGAYTGGSYDGQTTVQYNASGPSTTVSNTGLKQCSNLYCHGGTMAPNGGTNTTPTWDNAASAACGSCHGATTANPPTRGAHIRHAGSASGIGHDYACSLCHRDPAVDPSQHVNNQSEIQFSADPKLAGAAYSGTAAMLDAYGSCSNVYCHSNVQTSPPGGALTYKSVNWNDHFASDPNCGACHEGPMDHYSVPLTGNTTGSHGKHAASSIYCSTCHANNANEDPAPGGAGGGCTTCHTATGPNDRHGDYAINVNIVTIYGGTYSGTPAPGDNYGSCSTTYCHTTGVSVRTGSVPVSTVAWGSGVLACNACHGNGVYASPNNALPAYASGSPKENSHVEHAVNNNIACASCHAGTTATGTTIANAALHANKKYDMQASGTYAGATIAFTYTAASTTRGGSCSAVSCHGGNTAVWGATLTCTSCHGGASDVDDFTFGNGTFALVSSAQWTTTGHGRPAASGAYASGNAAADFTGNACQYCHDDTIAHNTGSNPFRLRNVADATWGLNGVCQNCHAESSAGVIVDTTTRNAAKKIGSVHYGIKHSTAANGGRTCWDCHDAHGDGNVFMVQGAVARTSDATTGVPTATVNTSFTSFTTGTDYAKSSAPFDGICNVCHTTTTHYTATSGDGHNAEARCTSCHTHTGDTATNGFRAVCDACHGIPPVDNTTLAGRVYPSSTGSTVPGAHATHVTNLSISCDSCHANSVGAGALHNNGDLTVSMGFSLFGGAYTGGSYDGQTTVQYNASGPSTTVSNTGLKQCSNLYCHGGTMAPNGGTNTAPTWDNAASAACGSCHGATTANPPTRGAHVRHTASAASQGHGYSCTLCHRDPSVDASQHVNNQSEIQFSTDPKVGSALYSGTAAMLDAYGSCSNVYCHSTVQTSPPGGAVTYRSVNWGDQYGANPNCSACHEGPVDHTSAAPLTGNTSGSHSKHGASSIYCSTCHANNANEDPSPASAGLGCTTCHGASGPYTKHGDQAIDVNIVTIYGGTYSGTPAPGDNYGSCSTTYCHTTGVSVRTGSVPASNVAWGSGTLACNACHGNSTYASPNNAMPAYVSGSPKENSHVEHVVNNNIACASCHAGTTATGTTIANAALHANKKYDMQASGAYSGATVSFIYSTASATAAGSCSAVSCHGGSTAVWGAKLTCTSCHGGASDVDDFTFGNGTFALVSTAQWTTTGHGRPTASGAYASGNAAANFTVTNACQYCHDNTIAHNNAANPFRLRNTADATWGLNGVCQSCHAEASAGVTVDTALRNGAKKVGAIHYGAKHNVSGNGGQFCWDCHDAHGDGNVFMVQGAVARTSNAATGMPTAQVATVFTLSSPVIGSDYAKSSAPFNGVCNVCHTNTSHYTATSGDGHNAAVNCNQCHSHSGGFQASGDSCSDCHSSAGGATPGTAPDAYHAKHVQTAYIGRISTGDYGNYTTNQWYRYANTGGTPDAGCGYCHPQNSATHMNGSVNLNFDPADAGAAGTLKARNNAVQSYTQTTGNVTCSSVYCHSNGRLSGSTYAYVATPNWYGGTFTGDKCASCHGNSPTGSAAHAAHAVGIHYNNIFTGTTGLATAGNTGASSHGYADVNGTELTSTTINCNVCHNSTVTAAANDRNTLCATCHTGSNLKGVMAIAAGATTHVNGAVEVVFTSTPIRSKAQIRDSLANVAELNNSWTRVNGYKLAGSYDVSKTTPTFTAGNCTTACHNSKPVSWTSTVTCNSCHTELP